MTTWIDLAVYSGLICVVWLAAPAAASRYAALAIADRNGEWAAAHREIVNSLSFPGLIAACGAWAAYSLAVLIFVQLDALPSWVSGLLPAEQWEALRDVNSTLLLIGLAGAALRVIAFHRWLAATVPPADRRQATLVPRSMDDFAPRWLQLAIYALSGAHVAAWIAAGLFSSNLPRGFWPQVAFVAAVSACCVLLTYASVSRRPTATSTASDMAMRRGGVRLGLAVQGYLIIWGSLRLYELAVGPIGVNVDRITHLLLVTTLSTMAMAALRTPPLRGPRSEGGVTQRALRVN